MKIPPLTPTCTPTISISLALQAVSGGLQDVLNEQAGKPVSFLLVTNVDGVTQHVSNMARSDSAALLCEMLRRWEAGSTDIPAHYNPALQEAAANDALELRGVGRDATERRDLCLSFNRKPSDDEMRTLHDLLRASIQAAAMAQQGGANG